MELYQLTAEKLSELLEKKECSSVELTQSVLDRIKAKDQGDWCIPDGLRGRSSEKSGGSR